MSDPISFASSFDNLNGFSGMAEFSTARETSGALCNDIPIKWAKFPWFLLIQDSIFLSLSTISLPQAFLSRHFRSSSFILWFSKNSQAGF